MAISVEALVDAVYNGEIDIGMEAYLADVMSKVILDVRDEDGSDVYYPISYDEKMTDEDRIVFDAILDKINTLSSNEEKKRVFTKVTIH